MSKLVLVPLLSICGDHRLKYDSFTMVLQIFAKLSKTINILEYANKLMCILMLDEWVTYML